MAFSLVGSVITQTGTDANLSGLSAIAGVTTTNFTSSSYITYSCAYRLVVQGTLTIDPEKEVFITSYAPPSITDGGIVRVDTTGVLNIGVPAGTQATKRYTHGYGLIITNAANFQGGQPLSGRVVVVSPGKLNLYSSIRLPSTAEIYLNDTTTLISNASIFNETLSYGNLRCGSTALSINGLSTNLGLIITQQPALLKNINVQGTSRAVVFYGSQNFNMRDYVSYASVDWDVEFIDTSISTSFNSSSGSNLRVRNWQLGAGNESRTAGYLKAVQECYFSIKNTSGTALNAAKVFVRDVNNGSRVNLNGQNDIADKTYIFTSDTSGLTNTVSIILSVWNKGPTGDVAVTKDLRFNANDQVTFNFSDYLSNLFSSTFTLRSLGGFNSEVRLVADSNITQTTVATVAAYTTIDDLSKFYDYAKYWRVQDSNLEYPSATTQPVNASGKTIDLGSRNLVVDATAASAFAINIATNTITIKASVFSKTSKFDKLITTGTITFVNGATPAIDLSYQDVSGLRVVINVLNIFPNSRIQLYNVNTATEVFNGIISGTSYSQQILFSVNQTIRYRAMYVNGTTAKKWVEGNATLTSSGLSITLNQEDDPIYNSIGIDGSTVGECSIVGSSLVININDADNKTTAQRLLAFEIAWLYTSAGMRDQNLYIEYPDSTHLIFLGGLKVKNIKPSPPLSITGASIVPEVGDPADVIDSTGGSININTDRVVDFRDTTKYLTTNKFLGLK